MNETTVKASISRVTLFEDRGEVVREGTVSLPGGAVTLRIPDVSPLISDAHLFATLNTADGKLSAATVQDVKVERRVVPVDDDGPTRVAELEERIRAAERAHSLAREKLQRAQHDRDAADALWQRFHEQFRRALWTHDLDASSAQEMLTTLMLEMRRTEDALPPQRDAVARAEREVQALRGTLAEHQRKPTRMRADLVVNVTGDEENVVLRVGALLPCALWRPSHDAHLMEGKVAWETFATVWQHTGEDWRDVELILSTARPSAGAQLPRLDEDRLTLRAKTAQERKVIQVEHRQEAVSRQDLKGGAPGVYDGGVARTFKPAGRVTIPSDGRPHRVAVGGFEAPASSELVSFPELAPRVYLRASFKNTAGHPLLAGPVTLMHRGGCVGTGDVPYVGQGESLDVSFGSDDRFTVRHTRRRVEQEKLLRSDVTHFVTEVELQHTGQGAERILVMLRVPVSEVAQLKVLPSPAHSTEGLPPADGDGLVKIPLRLNPGDTSTTRLAFHFDTSGDVRVPDPW